MTALNTLKSYMKSIGLKLSTMLYLIWFVLFVIMLVSGRALLNIRSDEIIASTH